MKKLHCPCCSECYISDAYLETHIQKKHKEFLTAGISPAQFLFNMRNHKSTNFGTCVICQGKTTFNPITKKYNRLCDNPECKERYVKEFKARMMKKYGTEHLLNNPDKQKEMLAHRKISGKYRFGKKTIITYTGDYEHDFLIFLDQILHYPESDVIAPAPMTFKYKYQNAEHFYIPDFYLPSLHLLIEIKASDNKHYRLRDIEQEKVKDTLALKSGFNYLKIFDKDYTEFFEYIEDEKYLKPAKSSDSVLNESIVVPEKKDIGELLLENESRFFKRFDINCIDIINESIDENKLNIKLILDIISKHIEPKGNLTPEEASQKVYDFYIERINNHVDSVKKYAEMIAKNFRGESWSEKLIANASKHDYDKQNNSTFIGNYAPYIADKYGDDNIKKYFKLKDHYLKEWDGVWVVMHIKNNKHHPEGWDENKYRFERWSPPYTPKNMDEVSMAEMCADWMAVGKELGNTALEFWEKKAKKFYNWSDDQIEFIEKVLKTQKKL